MTGVGALARKVVYAAADAVTLRRGVARRVDGITVRFAPAWARYYPSTYEPAKRSFLEARCRPGSTVVDVGAHIGLYTVVMARAVGDTGRVVSFEPTAATREALRRTVAMNGLGAVVEVRGEAVTDVDGGTVAFHDTGATMSNANSVVVASASSTAYDVPTTTIDAALAAHGKPDVSCLKIDVEGAELLTLGGAAGTLARCRPALALEVHPRVLGAGGMAELWDLLDGAGYAVAVGGEPLDRAGFVDRPDGFEVQCTAR